MDLFTRTFLPAAANTGLPMPVISRHLPLVRQCLGATDAVLMVTRCVLPDRPRSGEHLLVLTQRRLVVTHERRLAHRIHLHIDAPIHELSQVAWCPDPRLPAIELSATAIDGIRERFRIKVRQPWTAGWLDAKFRQVFRVATRALAPTAGIAAY